jgi:class 3 adenylate cyclase/TolB-like protein/Tfp pilus assembly protein PilF
MVQPRVERKPVSVVVADVVGFSRLTELDEEGTHARLNALQRDLIKPKISEHHGRIVKNTGDGALLEFASVVDAVRCAVEIQRGMIDRNTDFPEDRRIVFRIGINLGDVIVEPGDIHGDGVNVAARLEGLAEPGGVCISGTAHDQVRDRLPYVFTEKGEQTVKNIARPVRVYSLGANAIAALPASPPLADNQQSSGRYWNRGWLAAAGMAAVLVVAAGLWLGFKPAKEPSPAGSAPRLSIVVLPFANLSGDPAKDYLADVITEELTTALSRHKGTFVIARSTAFTYKGKPIDVKQIGKDLGVRYVLEGSAQPSDNKVRVTAQFIDAQTGAHLWADQFDADRSNLLEMQDEIVVRLSRALSLQFLAVGIARGDRTPPGNLDAQDLAMRCVSDTFKGPGGWATAPSLCDRALQIDPRNVLALSQLAFFIIFPVIISQSDDPIAATRRADELASRALAADPSYDFAHVVKAWVLMAQNRHEEAIVEAERGLALNPSGVEAYSAIGVANNFLCRPERVFEAIDKAIRLSPQDPSLWGFYEIKAEAYFVMRQDANTIEWVQRSVATVPTGDRDPYAMLMLASAFALSGQQAKAGEAIQSYLANKGAKSRTISQFQKQQLAMADNPRWLAYNERFAEGLRKAKLPE